MKPMAKNDADNSAITAKPIGRPFPKGVSGNAGGRPKLEAGVRELAQSYTMEAMQRLVALTQSEDERVAIVAIKCLLDRAWGTPKHMIEVPEKATLVVVRWSE
jgi:hypothetical protein